MLRLEALGRGVHGWILTQVRGDINDPAKDTGNQMTDAVATTAECTDPQRLYWNGAWILISVVTALPLVMDVRVHALLPYTPTLVIHELSGFTFFGHTFFSNLWSMRVRQTQNREAKLWAHQFIRKLVLGIALPTSIITPLAGLMLIDSWGGLRANPWAWEAYFCFWVMAAMQLTPDLITVGRNRYPDQPTRTMLGGALRGIASTALTIYIIICMASKTALLAPLVL